MTATSAVSATSAIAQQQAAVDAAAAGSATKATQEATDNAKLSSNYTTFMKLLTAQLQNQDPLQPTDTSQFTQQLVMYSQVEQQISSNSKLDSILSALNTNSASHYVDYIGKTVAVSSDKLVLDNSSAMISYTLPDTATNVKVNVTDSNGNPVATLTGATGAGDHNAAWDGKDSNGNVVADGTYTFKVVATDSTGATMANVKQYYVGPVTAITSSTGTSQLELDGKIRVDPADVVAIGG